MYQGGSGSCQVANVTFLPSLPSSLRGNKIELNWTPSMFLSPSKTVAQLYCSLCASWKTCFILRSGRQGYMVSLIKQQLQWNLVDKVLANMPFRMTHFIFWTLSTPHRCNTSSYDCIFTWKNVRWWQTGISAIAGMRLARQWLQNTHRKSLYEGSLSCCKDCIAMVNESWAMRDVTSVMHVWKVGVMHCLHTAKKNIFMVSIKNLPKELVYGLWKKGKFSNNWWTILMLLNKSVLAVVYAMLRGGNLYNALVMQCH